MENEKAKSNDNYFDYIREVVNSDDGIIAIHKVITEKDDHPIMIHINKNSSISGLLPVYLNNETIVEIHPEEYDYILGEKDVPEKLKNNNYKLPEGWERTEIIYEGDLWYKDLKLMISDIKDHMWAVEENDLPLFRAVGYKCKSGHEWHIKYTDIKKCDDENLKRRFSTMESRKKLLKELNEKTIYKTINESE